MQILENEDKKEKKKKGSCMNSLGQFLSLLKWWSIFINGNFVVVWM